MVDRRGMHTLSLSSLRPDREYPLEGRGTDDKCLIHVKLTESSAKDIDNLIASNKGAVFTLWFTENGGRMMIPAANGDRHFQFSTASLKRGGLECIHQSASLEDQKLLSLGPPEHKLTVRATEEVYETTKKRVTQVEAERQGTKAKEIQLTKGSRKQGFKSKPTFSTVTPSKPSGVAGITGRGGSAKTTPHSSSMFGKPTPTKAPPSASKSLTPAAPPAGRNQKTLRERIVHMLALRPLKREDIVTKLKKATKRSESAMTNINSILSEVAEIQDSAYHLRPQFVSELQVDNWPYYNDQERQLMKRKLNNIVRPPTTTSTSQDPPLATTANITTKRTVPDFNKPSKPKNTHPVVTESASPFVKKSSPPFPPKSTLNSTSNISPPLPANATGVFHSIQSDHKPPSLITPSLITTSSSTLSTLSTLSTNSSAESFTAVPSTHHPSHTHRSSAHPQQAPGNGGDSENLPVTASGRKRKRDNEDHKDKRKKKKHKHVKDQATIQDSSTLKDNSSVGKPARSDASSTSSSTDWSCEYPPIKSDHDRAEYKRLFNREYSEYLEVKRATDEVQEDVARLTAQLNSLRKDTDEFKKVKRKIRDKYLRIQGDKDYQKRKERFLLLHYKLAHVKKMVMEYDSLHGLQDQTLS